jgi:glucose-1-phosphate adenylyltransferase
MKPALTIAMIMAGGKGSRLGPLTTHRAKPAVPFGGRYRIIDFVLSNFVNSGYHRVYVLTQYMATSLIKHLNRNWHLGGIGQFIEVVPAQMRMGEHWYRGTADAVYQNMNLIRDAQADCVAVFGGDHVYKFAVDQMEEFHRGVDADLTVAAFPVPKKEASEFGVIQVDAEGRIVGFQEKPKDPIPLPSDPEMCLVSMGNYLFKAPILVDSLRADAANPESSHDFGKNIIPALVGAGRRVFVYDFSRNKIRGEPPYGGPYWRDVGSIGSYFQANMELRGPLPALNMYNRQWRIRTAQRDYPPARFVKHGELPPADIIDSLVCEGTIVQSADLDRVLLGYDCFVHAKAVVRNSVLLSGCDIGEGAQLLNVLSDKNCIIMPGATIGIDLEADKERFPFISPEGIVVLPKGTYVPAEGPIEIAYDMSEVLEHDPSTRAQMEKLRDKYKVGKLDRHSFRSSGPHYKNVPQV